MRSLPGWTREPLLHFVILGAVLAFYYVFVSGGLDEMRSRNQSQPTATPTSSVP